MSRRNDSRFDRKNFNSNRDYRSRNDRKPYNQSQNQPEDEIQKPPEVVETPRQENPTKMASEPIQSVKSGEKKFTGRCRLFVGNLPNNLTQEEFQKMFATYGETGEIYLNAPKGYGFVKLETRHIAETAKAALDGTLKDGRLLRVKFASNGAAVKVKNLSPWVTNELLETAFSHFGEIERAVVIVNDRGRPIGEGIVEFAKKQSAVAAIKTCAQECYLLSSSPRPVTVENLEMRDEEDGFPEKMVPRNNGEYQKDREMGPRFAKHGTFEYEYADRWKKLYVLEAQRREFLENELQAARRQMEEEMEFTYYDHEANMLREKLRRLEEQANLMQRDREMRLDADRRFDEQLRQTELMLREQEEEILRPRVARNAQGALEPPRIPDNMAAPSGGAGNYDAYGGGAGQYGSGGNNSNDQLYGKRQYPEHASYGGEDAKRRRY